MATQETSDEITPTDENKNGPVGSWEGRVSFRDDGTAYASNEVLCVGDEALEAARAALSRIDPKLEPVSLFDGHWVLSSTVDFDAVELVESLAKEGLAVTLNHVLFSHSTPPATSGCCAQCSCGGVPQANPYYANPYYANAVGANPYYANAVSANPYYANSVESNPYYANELSSNPYYANPYYANPYYANPYYANYKQNGERPSSARPALAPDPVPAISLPKDRARCYVLDTGFGLEPNTTLFTRANYTGVVYADRDQPDESGDKLLDPASGHGTFISGVLEQIAPGQDVRVCRVLSTFGFGKVSDIAGRLTTLSKKSTDKTIFNLSFGGYVDEDTPTLAAAIKIVQETGAIVVASAGNDGICRPSIPASLPDVISVGSIEAQGRAPYSNHGPWVRACAPGTNITSAFFEDFNGDADPIDAPGGSIDPDHFTEWANWTGTSFAAPIVVAVLMKHIAMHGSTAKRAVEAVIDNPSLLRFPGLGTVVNVTPGM